MRKNIPIRDAIMSASRTSRAVDAPFLEVARLLACSWSSRDGGCPSSAFPMAHHLLCVIFCRAWHSIHARVDKRVAIPHPENYSSHFSSTLPLCHACAR